jgi:hypothetical protein
VNAGCAKRRERRETHLGAVCILSRVPALAQKKVRESRFGKGLDARRPAIDFAEVERNKRTRRFCHKAHFFNT